MRKVFALLLVAGVFSLAACEEKKEETATEIEAPVETVDTATIVDPAPVIVDSVSADTAVVK